MTDYIASLNLTGERAHNWRYCVEAGELGIPRERSNEAQGVRPGDHIYIWRSGAAKSGAGLIARVRVSGQATPLDGSERWPRLQTYGCKIPIDQITELSSPVWSRFPNNGRNAQGIENGWLTRSWATVPDHVVSGLSSIFEREPVRSGKVPATDKPDSDALRKFEPKDASEYLAFMEGRTLHKTRLHEDLLTNFARHVRQRKFEVKAPHPRDMVLRRDGGEILVEAKDVGADNPLFAVRAALGQLLQYEHAYYRMRGFEVPILIALFSTPVGGYFTSFLEIHAVGSVWPENGIFCGSLIARNAGLCASQPS